MPLHYLLVRFDSDSPRMTLLTANGNGDILRATSPYFFGRWPVSYHPSVVSHPGYGTEWPFFAVTHTDERHGDTSNGKAFAVFSGDPVPEPLASYKALPMSDSRCSLGAVPLGLCKPLYAILSS
jgi:hypothetical protein